MIRPGLLTAALLLVLAACGAQGPARSSVPADPADPAAQVRPDLIIADPAVVSPGDVVALRFPEETNRGILFTLDELVGDAWATRYYLLSDGPGPEWHMSWHPPNAAGLVVEDIGVGGTGPDRVPIPEVATPGSYRICTGNAGDEFCAQLEIVAP